LIRVNVIKHLQCDGLVPQPQGCRNTVFNAQAQSGARYLKDLAGAGYGALRVELVDEPPEVVAPLLEGYRYAHSSRYSEEASRG